MKRRLSFVYAIGTIIAFCGCASYELQSSPPGAKMLNQTELEHLFHEERTVEFPIPGGVATVNYFPDGRQEIDWSSGNDTGTFRINKEEFCSTWANLRNGAESCSKIKKISENEFEFINRDGDSHTIMRLK